jgi:hypothetical protein
VQAEARRECRALILACVLLSLALSSCLPEPTGRYRASVQHQSSSLILSLHKIYVFKYYREHSVAHLPPIADWKRSWRMHAHASRTSKHTGPVLLPTAKPCLRTSDEHGEG